MTLNPAAASGAVATLLAKRYCSESLSQAQGVQLVSGVLSSVPRENCQVSLGPTLPCDELARAKVAVCCRPLLPSSTSSIYLKYQNSGLESGGILRRARGSSTSVFSQAMTGEHGPARTAEIEKRAVLQGELVANFSSRRVRVHPLACSGIDGTIPHIQWTYTH